MIHLFPYLIYLFVLKELLFSVFYNFLTNESDFANGITTVALIKALLPQSVFIVVIYFVLAIGGSGLWFFVGKLYYFSYSLLLSDIKTLKENVKEKYEDIERLIKYYKLFLITRKKIMSHNLMFFN